MKGNSQINSNLEEGLYLVKVPNIVYNYVSKVPHNTKFGKIEAKLGQDNKLVIGKKRVFNVSLEGNIQTKNFEFSTDSAFDLFAFKENKTKILKINRTGRFVSKDENISDIITKRIHKEEENKKTITMIETSKGRPLNEGIIKLSDHQFYAINDNEEKAILQKNRKDKNLKKTRMDKNELVNRIFDMFSSKKFWTIKEFVDKLDQPENFLKEELSKLCNFIKSGPQKGSFELKEQYENIDRNE